jgi:hypothetical protein
MRSHAYFGIDKLDNVTGRNTRREELYVILKEHA